MREITDIIEMTVERTGQPKEVVEPIIRNMFRDIQQFTSKKKGVNIQMPHIGTFYFRSSVIPNYANKQKSTLAYWISRLFIGQDKRLTKTIDAATNNIHRCLDSLNKVSLIKQEFLDKHARYKPKARAYLQADTETDMERMAEYIKNVKAEFFLDEIGPAQETDM